MFELTGPIKNKINIPNDMHEDNRYFSKDELQEAVAYYLENGYVVLRSAIPESFCDQVDREYQSSVKDYEGFIYRQTGGNPEKHRMNDRGFLMNPILNIQDLPKARLGEFSGASLKVITHENVLRFFETLYGEKPKVVQTMFFEGNSETWAHQDTYYLDSEKIGEMAAAWFAVEDIRPGAGRFFIYPGSHMLDIEKNEGDINVGFNHKNYIELVKKILKEKNLEVRAPALSKGDVLIWNSKNIHGSLETLQP